MKRLLGIGRVSAYHRLMHGSVAYLCVRVVDQVSDDGVAYSKAQTPLWLAMGLKPTHTTHDIQWEIERHSLLYSMGRNKDIKRNQTQNQMKKKTRKPGRYSSREIEYPLHTRYQALIEL